MRILRPVAIAVAAVCALRSVPPVGAETADTPAAKLIEYGWDVPTPEFLRDHIRQMERRPFDGLVFRVPAFDHAFDPRPWSAAELAPQLAALEAIAWDRFTDNFLMLFAANQWGMDWADDGQWAVIEANLRLAARAAQRGRCAGVCFDAEPYGGNPWAWEGEFDPQAFAARQGQVRRRGAQFMAALQCENPSLRLLTFFLLSYHLDIADEPDGAQRQSRLASTQYALLPAFLDGILDAAGPQVRIIDGNEGAYYHTREGQYRQAADDIRKRALPLVAPERRQAYARHVQVGMAIYADQLLARRGPAGSFLSYYLQPTDQLRWVEHNTYWALRTADEYAWFYSERLDWWEDRDVPAGLPEALGRAREAVRTGGNPGFDLAPILQRAEAGMQAAFEARCVRRAAEVPFAAAGPPRIDGDLGDAAWPAAAPLEAFVPSAFAGGAQAEVPTLAWVTYDDDGLYVALRCAEPRVDSLRIAGRRHDDALWNGDTVELFLSQGAEARPYVHFIVNPGNAQWDGDSSEEGDRVGWDAAWQSAVARGDSSWTAELAVPWSALGGRPAAGSHRRANLCRQRAASGEITSWSTVVQGFLESERFGEWTFRQ